MSQRKALQMAMRIAVGNRLLPPQRAPRLKMGGQYLTAHACFRCRKSFRIPLRPAPARCPQCRLELHEMGRSFKAPPARNREQWRKVEALHAAGFRFFSYRTFDCPPLPARLREVAAFVRDNPDHPFRIGGR